MTKETTQEERLDYLVEEFKADSDALKVWLREAEFIYPSNQGEQSGMPTELFKKIEPLGAFNPLVWAII